MLSVATHDFDLVVEGTASKISDPQIVAAMAARWAADGWPAGLTTAAKPSRRTSALHRPDHHPGLSIASMSERPPRWPQLRQAVRPAGGSDAVVSIEFRRAVTRPRLGIDSIEIPGAHSPFLARPRGLAALLDQLARA